MMRTFRALGSDARTAGRNGTSKRVVQRRGDGGIDG